MQNRFMTTLNGIFDRIITHCSLNGASLSINAGELGNPHKYSSNLKIPFNFHNPHQDHRDPSACDFLLVS